MNHRDDEKHDTPGGSDTTGQGYPEEQPAGIGIDAHDHAEDDIPADDDHGAPQTSPDRDSEPSKATGNPHAAGG